MGFDRRLLTRYAFALSGEVVWGKAKRFSSKLIPTRSKMTTADLSLGGLCVRVHEPTELQSGSTCIVSLGGAETAATVVDATFDHDEQVLRLALNQADPAFLAVIENYLPSRREVRAVEHQWIGDGTAH